MDRGLRTGFVGTPVQVAECIGAFEKAGLNLLLLQRIPELEEMERFAELVIKPGEVRATATVRGKRNPRAAMGVGKLTAGKKQQRAWWCEAWPIRPRKA